MGMEHYVKVRELGGSNGAFLGYDKQDRERKVVIKRLTSGAQGMEELSALLRVQSFRHLAQIYESFVYRGHLYIVMRYYDGGDLEDKFNELRCRELLRQGGHSENEHHDKHNTTNMENNVNLFNVEEKNVSSNKNNALEGSIQLANAETLSLEHLRLRLHWAEMIVKAVKCCHEQHIVHRDIKPGNIFVAYNKQQKSKHKSSKKLHKQEREEEEYREMESDYSDECENRNISKTKLQERQEWPSSPSLSSSSSLSTSSLSSVEQSLESAKSHTSTSYSKAKSFEQKEFKEHYSNSLLNNSWNNNHVKSKHQTDREVQLYLGDFGSAKALQSSSLTSTFVGSPLWLAPEVLEGMSYGMPSDIWSLGCVLYEMFTLQRPFHATSFVQLVESVTHGRMAHALPDTLPHELCTLIMRMLSVNPSTRPSAIEVLHVIRELYHTVGEQIKHDMSCKENNTEQIKHEEMIQHNNIIHNESDNDVSKYRNYCHIDSSTHDKKKASITASKTGRVAEISNNVDDQHEQYSYVHSSPSSECITNDNNSNNTNDSKVDKNIKCERQSLWDNNKKQKEMLNKQNLEHELKVPLRSVCSFPVISTSSSFSTSKWPTKKSCSNVSSYIAMSDNHNNNNNIHINDESENNDNDVAKRKHTSNKKSTDSSENTSSEVNVASIKSLSRGVQENKALPNTSTSMNSSQVAHHLNKSEESTLIAVHTNNNSENRTNSDVKLHNKNSLLPAIKTRSSTCAKQNTSLSSLFSAPTLITVDTHDFASFDAEESHQGHTLTHHNEHQPSTKLHKVMFNKGNTHNYSSISQAVKLEMLDNVTQTAPVVMLRADNYTSSTTNNKQSEENNNSENKVNKPFRANNIRHPNNINNQKSKLINRSNDSMSAKVDGNSNNSDTSRCCNSEERLINKESQETNIEKDHEMINKPKEKSTSLSLLARLSRQTTSSSQKMKNSNLSNESFCNEEINEDKVKNDEEVDKTCTGLIANANMANNNNTNNSKNAKRNSHSHNSINSINNKVWKVEKAPPAVKLAPIRHGPATSTSSCSSHSSLMINNSTFTNNNTSSSNIKQSNSYLINNTGQKECTNETTMTQEPFLLLEKEEESVGAHKAEQEPRKSLDNKLNDTVNNNDSCRSMGDDLRKDDNDDVKEENKSVNNGKQFADCIECSMESEGTEAKSDQIKHTTNENKKIINEKLSSSSSCTSSLDTLSSSKEANTIKSTQPPHISHLPETKNVIKDVETASLTTLSSASTPHGRMPLHDKIDQQENDNLEMSEEKIKVGNLTSSTNDETREDTWLIRQQQELLDIEQYLMSHEAHDNNILQGYNKPRRNLRNAHKNMHRNSGKEATYIINDDDDDEFYNENNTSKDKEEKDEEEEEEEEDDMWYYNLHTKSKPVNGQYAHKILNKYQEMETSWQLNQVRSNNEANRKSPSCTRSNHFPSVDNNNRSKYRYKSSSPEKQYHHQHQHHSTRRTQRSHEVYHHTQRQASEARGHKILTQEEQAEANRQRAEARAKREAERLSMVKMINERRMQAKRERQEKELQHREEPHQEVINSRSSKEEEKEQNCNNNKSVPITTSYRQANPNNDINKNFNNHDKHEQSNLVNYVVASKKKTYKDEHPCKEYTNSRQEGKGKLRRKTDVKVEIRLPDNLRYTE